jgi:hypothetical protein
MSLEASSPQAAQRECYAEGEYLHPEPGDRRGNKSPARAGLC